MSKRGLNALNGLVSVVAAIIIGIFHIAVAVSVAVLFSLIQIIYFIFTLPVWIVRRICTANKDTNFAINEFLDEILKIT